MSSKRLILAVGVILLVGGAVLAIAGLAGPDDVAVTSTTAVVVDTTTVQEDLPGVSELQSGDVAGARAKVRAHLEKNPDDTDAWFFLAMTYEQSGDLKGALDVYEQVLEVDPNNYEAHFRIGQLQSAQNDLPAAAQSFDQALQINSDFTAARVALAEVDTKLGNIDKAIKLYFDVIEMRPLGVHLDGIRVSLAKLLISVGQAENAAIQLNKALAENPDNAEAKELLAKSEGAGGSSPGSTAKGGATSSTTVGALGAETAVTG